MTDAQLSHAQRLWRMTKAVERQLDAAGDTLSNCGEHDLANDVWAVATRYKRLAFEQRQLSEDHVYPPGHKHHARLARAMRRELLRRLSAAAVAWYEGDDDCELHEALGMTWEQRCARGGVYL